MIQDLKRFFLLGSSARSPGKKHWLSSGDWIKTRAPTYSRSSFGLVSNAMWCPDTKLLPFSSKITLYLTLPSSAKTKNRTNEKKNRKQHIKTLAWGVVKIKEEKFVKDQKIRLLYRRSKLGEANTAPQERANSWTEKCFFYFQYK